MSKARLPDFDTPDAAPFLKVYDAAKTAGLDTRFIDKAIESALKAQYGLTYQQARLWWAHHLINARPLD